MTQTSSSPNASPTPPSDVHGSAIEETIARMIEGIRKLLNPQYGNMTPEEEAAAVIKINSATQKHFELQIRILQDAPRDPDKLRQLLKVKQKEYEEAIDSIDIERLVSEIDMLKFVLFLVKRNSSSYGINPREYVKDYSNPVIL